ncbi:MAG: CARDB domain-containing protein, partial [Chloroflexota bacterium]
KPPAPPAVAPAEFVIGSLSVTPGTVKPAEQVTISTMVTNIGGSEGTYTVVLKINGAEEARKDVTLAAGKSQTVSFTTTRAEAGSYTVSIDGQTAQFTVTAPQAVTPPKPPTNWGLIWGIIAGVIVLGIVLWLAVFRRRIQRN